LIVQDGQIVLIDFPQPDQSTGKLRPALVIRRLPGRHDDWLICLISTQLSQLLPGFDELVQVTDQDFEASGLKKTSVIRISRLATVEQRLFVGSIGQLSAERMLAVKGRLARWITETPTPV
jgi:mRNA interferase MazF